MKPRLTIGSLLIIALQLSSCQPASLPTINATPSRLALSPTPIPAPTSTQPPNPRSFPTPTIPAHSEPYRNCTRTPGVSGCDPSAPSIAIKIAYFSPADRLVVIDFATGSGWQYNIPKPVSIVWSPDGSQLSVVNESNTDNSLYQYSTLFFNDTGELKKAIQSDDPFGRTENTPLGSEEMETLRGERVGSSDGAVAWVTGNWDYKTRKLHIIEKPGSPEQEIPLDLNKGYDPFELIAFLPEIHTLIGFQRELSVMNEYSFGSELYWVDPHSKKILLTGLRGHLIAKDLTELKGYTLALVDYHYGASRDGRLALVDCRIGQVQTPFSENTRINSLSWQSGSSEWIAIQATQSEGADPIPGQTTLAQGIYLYNIRSGAVQRLVSTENGWRDRIMGWSDDGKNLIYIHFPDDQKRLPFASLMMYSLADGTIRTLMNKLNTPFQDAAYLNWDGSMKLYIPK